MEKMHGVSAPEACPVTCGTCESTGLPVPAPTPIPKEDCADSTTWYYEKESKTCDAYVAKKTKNCKLKDERM